MIKEAIDRILDLSREEVVTVEDRQYATRNLTPITPPQVLPLGVNTLQAIVDWLGGAFDGETHGLAIHVVDPGNVQVISEIDDQWRSRNVMMFASLKHYPCGFSFGQFYEPEQFVIALQADFVPDHDRDKILKVAGNITAGAVTTSADDGISQAVTSKVSVETLKGTSELPNPVTLAPYRTFREIEQPASTFVFRARAPRGDGLPTLALFEADGGAWKIEAIHRVKAWLSERVSVPIFA